MHYRVFLGIKFITYEENRAIHMFRGPNASQARRAQEICTPAELFTVDNPGSRGKIADVRIPPQHRLQLPQDSFWGNMEFCLGETMNKADLVDRIAGACEISKTQATTAIDTAVDSITAALNKGDRVALIGFGTFSVSQRKARNGRNPQTGATIKIAARRVAKFTPGAELKKAVNKK